MKDERYVTLPKVHNNPSVTDPKACRYMRYPIKNSSELQENKKGNLVKSWKNSWTKYEV